MQKDKNSLQFHCTLKPTAGSLLGRPNTSSMSLFLLLGKYSPNVVCVGRKSISSISLLKTPPPLILIYDRITTKTVHLKI